MRSNVGRERSTPSKRRLAAREQERRWAEEATREFEEAEMKRKEQALLTELLGKTERWQKSQTIRAYIEAVEEAAIQKDGVVTPSSDIGKRLDWANERADRLDPLLTDLSTSEMKGTL